MKFCLIRNKEGNFLGREYQESHNYSTYTNEASHFDNVFCPMMEFLNDNGKWRLTIFETPEKVQSFLKDNNYWEQYRDCTAVSISEIVTLFEDKCK